MGGHIVGYYAATNPSDLNSVSMLCPHGIDYPGYLKSKQQLLKEGKHFLLPTNLEDMRITTKRMTYKNIPWPTIILKGILQDKLDRQLFYQKCTQSNDDNRRYRS